MFDVARQSVPDGLRGDRSGGGTDRQCRTSEKELKIRLLAVTSFVAGGAEPRWITPIHLLHLHDRRELRGTSPFYEALRACFYQRLLSARWVRCPPRLASVTFPGVLQRSDVAFAAEGPSGGTSPLVVGRYRMGYPVGGNDRLHTIGPAALRPGRLVVSWFEHGDGRHGSDCRGAFRRSGGNRPERRWRGVEP